MRSLLIGPLLLFGLGARPCTGAEVAYTFSGMVTFSPAPPFGQSPLSFLPLTPVSGHFAYDTDTVGNEVTTNCVDATCYTYKQQRQGGFVASVGGVEFRADEYFVTVSDAITPLGIFDQFQISFQGAEQPNSSLFVNGVAQENGKGTLAAALMFSSTEFSAANSLPTSLGSPIPNAATSILGDDSPQGIVFFLLSSISETTLPPPPQPASLASPEPTSFLLALLGLGMIGMRRTRTR